jgi:hypothetical protein
MIKDAYFPAIGSTAYGVDGLDIKEGIQVTLITDHAGKWFFDNDEVLSIEVQVTPSGTLAHIVGLSDGESTILFMNGTSVVDQIVIKVISDQAVSLGLSAGTPEPK